FGYLALLQVTRRKGETNSRRDRRNGYVHRQESHRRSDRYREQARSYSLIRVHPKKMVDCQTVIADKPAPTV
ncbi:hypothetical protein, partial [Pseudomonas sp. p50(2008)]|uniref:hypothetical protein n=1 Tax=Pseudomonas sp. p50(2008) TaxID=2816832 RepID=UPI001ABD2EE6